MSEKEQAIEIFEEAALQGEVSYEYAQEEILSLYSELHCLEA